MFDFQKPENNLSWADNLLIEAHGSGRISGGDSRNIAERYIDAFTAGISPQNCLILIAENVDKRQRLFNYIKKHGVAVDCSVAAGFGAAAQKAQKEILREMVMTTLAEYQKKIEPRALELFFERVGFHPVAVVNETEKLANYVGSREMITCADLDKMVLRSREDALYELTDALGRQHLGSTLKITSRLIDNGTHALAILATLRNYVRKLLIFRSLQLMPSPLWQSHMNTRQFQDNYLPELKKTAACQDLLGGHPYALYMSFKKADEFPCDRLKKWLTLILQAEYRLKGSPISQTIVLDEMFITMLSNGSI